MTFTSIFAMPLTDSFYSALRTELEGTTELKLEMETQGTVAASQVVVFNEVPKTVSDQMRIQWERSDCLALSWCVLLSNPCSGYIAAFHDPAYATAGTDDQTSAATFEEEHPILHFPALFHAPAVPMGVGPLVDELHNSLLRRRADDSRFITELRVSMRCRIPERETAHNNERKAPTPGEEKCCASLYSDLPPHKRHGAICPELFLYIQSSTNTPHGCLVLV
ncbi:hypothetical protein HPB51_025496 [Rhipicephalus microplus]|uniref:Uncharacterized protein n=1 Tax=Rhipicephalus microplus TaxID=6941 RepID=A0A9J6EJ77_RHIMP|nr:hypothetical protein HPB51_025496 [Rhipicephalus microplus]